MLTKFTPGVNFNNYLLAVFTPRDPKSEKKTDILTVFFVLLGSALVKATCKNINEIVYLTKKVYWQLFLLLIIYFTNTLLLKTFLDFKYQYLCPHVHYPPKN